MELVSVVINMCWLHPRKAGNALVLKQVGEVYVTVMVYDNSHMRDEIDRARLPTQCALDVLQATETRCSIDPMVHVPRKCTTTVRGTRSNTRGVNMCILTHYRRLGVATSSGRQESAQQLAHGAKYVLLLFIRQAGNKAYQICA